MLIGLLFGLFTGFYARVKGYSFFAWFLAGGLIGIAILYFLPDTIEVKRLMEPEEVYRLRKRGNFIGIAISVLSIAAGVLLEFVLTSHWLP